MSGLGELDGLVGGIGAGAGDDGHAAADGRDDRPDDVHVLLVAEGGRLAGRADGNQAVDPALDLVLNEFLEVAVGDLVMLEGRDERRECTSERTEFHGSRQCCLAVQRMVK